MARRIGGWREFGRYGLVAVVFGVGIAAASGQNVAWADDGHADTADRSPSQSAPGAPNSGPRKVVDKQQPSQLQKPSPWKRKLDLGNPRDWAPRVSKAMVPVVDRPVTESLPAVPSLELKPSVRPRDLLAQWKANRDTLSVRKGNRDKTPAFELPAATDLVTATKPSLTDAPLTKSAPSTKPSLTRLLTDITPAPGSQLGAVTPFKAPNLANVALNAPRAAVHVVGAVDSIGAADAAEANATTTTAPQPQPLSPIAKLIDAPGRFVNKVLQALDFTSSAQGPSSPFNWNTIDEVVFAVFRRTEDVLGLGKTPAVQPVPQQIVYSCSELNTCEKKTPTVAQFLNAATTEYVLGGQPGDLKPFVVDGHQMRSTNTLSGMSASAWVTPDGQVIIAYSGTTGGTNLLANPVIAITQVIADIQVVVTRTTPWAFYDALAFANEVRAEAHKQGYTDDDIFVTGHSLGAWEAQYVAQQTGLGGVGFEGPGLNTTNPANNNGANSNFVNVLTHGDAAGYFSSDVPGLEPLMAWMPGGDNKPHYGNIVMIGNPDAANPMINAAALFGANPVYIVVVLIDLFGNFMQYHLPGVQAYHLGVDPDPGVVPWLGYYSSGYVNEGWGELTIPQLQQTASDQGVLTK